MKVNIIGLGYVGLTLALILADTGFQVIGIEKDKKKIQSLRVGKSPLYEPEIDQFLESALNSKKITFDEKIIPDNDEQIYIVCVGTPINNQTHKPILENLENVTTEIGKNLKKGELVILRSTVPIGTTRKIVLPILEKESGLKCPNDFSLVFAPERTLQGKALKELRELSQIIGGIDQRSVEKASSLFNKTTKTVVRVSSLEAAEVIKLFDNTYRDITISIGNLFGKICDRVNIDAHEVIEAANHGYQRNKILFPGAGVGGGCLVKDPYLLLSSLDDSIDLDLIRSSRRTNDSMIQETINLLKNSFKKVDKTISQSKILVLGFAFKGIPDTDDVRYSPTLPIIEFLKEEDAILFGYDPNVSEDVINNLEIENVSDIYEKKIDCVLIMNNNPKFKSLNFKKFKKDNSNSLLVIDGWYLYDSKLLNQTGINYFALGSKK